MVKPDCSELTFSVHLLKKYFSNFVQKVKLHSQIVLVENSCLFDSQWYLDQYEDVARASVNPLTHYLLSGAQEGRDPHPLFDTQWYFEQYPNVAQLGINPLVHYISRGATQGYDPNPLFDTDWYCGQYSDVSKAINPLTHYVSFGAAQNYDPSPIFSSQSYTSPYSGLEEFKVNPLAHYLRRGTRWLEKLLPDILDVGPVIPRHSELFQSPAKTVKILFIGHDASATGAPVLLLNVIRCLSESFGVEAVVILLTGGPLEAEFKQLATTYIIDKEYKDDKDYRHFKHLVLSLWKDGYRWSFCNTAATGKCTEILYRAGFIVVSAIHEMQSVICAMNLEEESKTIARYAHKVIFAAEQVRRDFEQIAGKLNSRAVINPQGLLKAPKVVSSSKKQICDLLKISSDSILILAAGLGDLRKGLDLYLQLARYLGPKDSRFHFIWIGNIASNMEPWFKHDIDTEVLRKYFHHLPFTNELPSYYQAADVFVLPSREDPFPNVVLDALAHGIPVVAFDNCGGYVDLLASKQNGELVSYGDIEAMAEAIQRIANDPAMYTIEMKKKREAHIIGQYDFQRYVGNILKLFDDRVLQCDETNSLALSGSSH